MKSMLTHPVVDRFVDTAAKAGVILTPTDDHAADIYVLHDEQGVRYIGKAETAGGVRHRNETTWTTQARESKEVRKLTGFENAVRVNDLHRVMFTWTWAPQTAVAELEEWGPSMARTAQTIREGWIPGTADVEKFLIRMQIAAGVYLMNSAGAGQWENHLGTVHDDLAHAAVHHGIYGQED